MKKFWKPSRGKQTALNLILAALVFTLIWGLSGYPLPAKEKEFRRMERENLLPRSELIFLDDGREKDLVPEDENLVLTLYQPTFIGIAGEKVTAAAFDGNGGMVDWYPLEEGPTPVPFGYAHAVLYKPGFAEFLYPLMFIQVSQEAAQGELSLNLTYRETDYSWSGQGWNLGDGVWIFPIKTPDTGYTDYWWQGARYTLTLYRADGSLLLEQRGRLAVMRGGEGYAS